MSNSEGESIEEESRRIEKRSDTRVINGVVHPPIHPSIRLAKGNGCNKRMIRPIYTYFQSVITDPCTGIWYGKKRRRRTGEESGEKTGQQRGWLALGLLAGRDAMFNWQLFSLAHRNRSEGGETRRGREASSLSCVRAARGEKEAEGGESSVASLLADVSGGAVLGSDKEWCLEREMRNESAPATEERIKAATPGRTVFTIGRNT